MELLSLELRKLGLKEKEVKVYLAGLEMGPNSAKDIAKRAGITRPTTYEIIRRLEKKGLFIEAKQNKKNYFVAQSPNKILGILRIQKKEIEEKEREFIRIIATLEAKYSKETSKIKTYKGKSGINLLEESFSFTPVSEIFILSPKINKKEIENRNRIYKKIKKRLGKIKIKELYSGKLKKESKIDYIQRKFFPIPIIKGTLILSNKAILIYTKKEKGVLIEDKLTIKLLKALFLALWKIAQSN